MGWIRNRVASLDPRVKSWKELGIGSSVSCPVLSLDRRMIILGSQQIFYNGSQRATGWQHVIWRNLEVVVSNSLFFHPNLGKKSNLTHIFQMGVSTTNQFLWVPECHNLRVSSFDELYKTEDQPRSWSRKMSQVAKWSHFPHHCWV